VTAGARPIAPLTPSVPGAAQTPRAAPALRIYYLALVALLYVPIAILFVFSINAGSVLAFPIRGLTLDWYGRVLGSPGLLGAAFNSVVVASATALSATVLGTMVALLLVRFRFRGRTALLALSALPLIVPFVVLAVALFVLFRAIGLERSLVTVWIAHTTVALPYALLIIVARLAGFERSLEEAAMDLGATYPGALRLVVLPLIAPAMVAAALTSFTVSFDEFALALFVAGRDPTFPVYLFGQLRFATTLPIMIAMAVLLMAASVALLLVAQRILRTR
jgi:spermidine/putrescine transport system permease protein